MAANVDLPSGVTQEAGEESPTTPPTPETEVSSAPENEQELSPTEETTQEEQVTLSTPSPGEQVQIAVVPGLKIYADFDLQSQELTATDADLIIEFDNGAVITLTDFALYAAGDTPPMMVLSDGSLISGDTLVFSYTGTEIEPAAGPTLTSGGSGEYRDDLGDLIGGLDRLGGQDPDPFGAGIVAPVEDEEFNLAPDAVDDLVTTDEDTAITIPVLNNDSDPENDTLTVTDFTQTSNGTLVSNGDGTFTYTPDQDYKGPDSFTYTITDGNGNFDTATVTINVGPINDPPDAVNDAYETPEDAALSIVIPGVLANDTDLDGDALTVISNTAPTNGTVEINADGSFIYTPNANFNGADSFTYTVSDGNGGTDTATVNINVTPVNDAPVATDNLNSVAEDGTLVASGNLILDDDGFGVDSDIDNPVNDGSDNDLDVVQLENFEGTLSIDGTIIGQYGSLAWNVETGAYEYTLDNTNEAVQGLGTGETLTDTFTYTLSDGDKTDTAGFTITINGANDPPNAVDDDDFSVNNAFLVASKTPNDAPFHSAVLDQTETNAYTFEFTMPFKVADMTYNGEGQLFGVRGNDGAVFLMNPLAEDPPSVDETGESLIGRQDLEFKYFLPSETGTNINGIAFFGNYLYVINGANLFVVDPPSDSESEAVLVGGGFDIGVSNPIDLVELGGALYTISKSGSDGEVYKITLDPETGLPSETEPSEFLGTIDLSSLTNPYGMVAGLFDPDGNPDTINNIEGIYVVGSTGSSGSVLFFNPEDPSLSDPEAPTFDVLADFPINDVSGGTFLALAGEVDFVLSVNGLIDEFLANDTDPNGDPLTITEVNGTDITQLTTGESLVFEGRFGNLTITHDGQYTYELPDSDDDGIPDNPDPGWDIFTYTIDDGNGGIDTANIIFKVNNNFGGEIVRGGDGVDNLVAFDGNDLLIGGLGDDLLTGDNPLTENGGSDTFLFAGGEGNDTITDFSITEGDILRLTDVLDINDHTNSGTIDGLIDAYDVLVTEASGTDVTLEFTGSEGVTTITLEGVGPFSGANTLADLTGLQVDFNDDGGI